MAENVAVPEKKKRLTATERYERDKNRVEAEGAHIQAKAGLQNKAESVERCRERVVEAENPQQMLEAEAALKAAAEVLAEAICLEAQAAGAFRRAKAK